MAKALYRVIGRGVYNGKGEEIPVGEQIPLSEPVDPGLASRVEKVGGGSEDSTTALTNDTDPVDPVDPVQDIDALRARAKELGVTYSWNTSAAKLSESIKEAEAKASA